MYIERVENFTEFVLNHNMSINLKQPVYSVFIVYMFALISMLFMCAKLYPYPW